MVGEKKKKVTWQEVIDIVSIKFNLEIGKTFVTNLRKREKEIKESYLPHTEYGKGLKGIRKSNVGKLESELSL